MHSEATDRRSRIVAMDGLARDVVGYPAVAVGIALVLGRLVGSPLVGVLAAATLALGGLTAVVVNVDDLVGSLVTAYGAADAAPQARVAASLLSTVVWAGAAVVGLALA
jgi:hypothetical protein